MKKINIAFLLTITHILFSCSNEKKDEKNANEIEITEVNKIINEEPKKSSFGEFVKSIDLESHQKIIEKDKHSSFAHSIDDFLIKKLQLDEIFKTDIEIYSVTIPDNMSQNYNTLIVGIENTCCFYETYLVNYSLEGVFIDKLLITQGDYIESFTHLGSRISGDSIKRVLYKTNYDVEPNKEEKWKKDTFTINENGNFQGENLIFKTDKELAENQIKFIKEKYGVIASKMESGEYTMIEFEYEANEGGTACYKRAMDGEQIRFMSIKYCSDHGCTNQSYYFWDNQVIFYLKEDSFWVGNTDKIEELRQYYLDEKLIKCLARKADGPGGYEAIKKKINSMKQTDTNCSGSFDKTSIEKYIGLTEKDSASLFN